jgi:hypothetical protein
MTKVTLTKTHQNPPNIVQSRLKRDWMDNTYKKHAYQCLPMTTANVHGWEVLLPQDVVVQWDGGNTNVKILSGEEHMGRTFAYGGIIGMVSFSVGWAFGTEKGYDTWISGSPNYIVDGASPLSAIIPSSWWPDEFQMNWVINKVGEPVTFAEGTPFMFFNIFKSDLLESVEFEVDNLWDKPDVMNARAAYGDAKMKKNIEEPWTWMKGIKTGLDEKGERIGPGNSGLLKLNIPSI